MYKIIVSTLLTIFLVCGCSSSQKNNEPIEQVEINEDFTDSPEILIQHPSWASRKADFFLQEGAWKLRADGTHISETWKTYKDTLPPDLDWSISVDVTVPYYWDTVETEEAQVGAGVFVGKIDPNNKSRTVYETNLAAIAHGERFVQGQLIKNRLGDDPIAVGFMKTDRETVNLMITWDKDEHMIRFYMDEILVDAKHINAKGIDDWQMTADQFYVGVMGFAENTDITGYYPYIDNFKVLLE